MDSPKWGENAAAARNKVRSNDVLKSFMKEHTLDSDLYGRFFQQDDRTVLNPRGIDFTGRLRLCQKDGRCMQCLKTEKLVAFEACECRIWCQGCYKEVKARVGGHLRMVCDVEVGKVLYADASSDEGSSKKGSSTSSSSDATTILHCD